MINKLMFLVGNRSYLIDDRNITEIPDGMGPFGKVLKRLFDIIVSLFCLILLSPVSLIICILIIKEDRGPVIYRQERIGRLGKPFFILKFRSMHLDSEPKPALTPLNNENEEKLTKIGSFLRAYHLDEIPQFWNVIKGDMSLVGYRPERQYFIDRIMEKDSRYKLLYQINPGITSYATIYNGYTDTMEKMLLRLDYDLYYLAHRSLWMDFCLLVLTFVKLIKGKRF